jgi:predicted methyltransferase
MTKINAFKTTDGKIFTSVSEAAKYSEENLGEKYEYCDICKSKGYIVKTKEEVLPSKYGIGDKRSEFEDLEIKIIKTEHKCYHCNGVGYRKLKLKDITKTIVVGQEWV